MAQISQPNPQNHYLANHTERLCDSFYHWLGKPLVDPSLSGPSAAQFLYDAPFILVSHGTEDDPIFNYANRAAQHLFEFSWEEFTTLPSRFSAELPNREERDRLLAEVSQQGYIDNYAGVRITKTGRRFTIQKAVVWNVMDSAGHPYGQAAMFHQWQYLNPDHPIHPDHAPT